MSFTIDTHEGLTLKGTVPVLGDDHDYDELLSWIGSYCSARPAMAVTSSTGSAPVSPNALSRRRVSSRSPWRLTGPTRTG